MSIGATPSQPVHDPLADPKAVVRAGGARFTVLTSALIRMEWSAAATFEDRASLVFVNRRTPVPAFEVDRKGGWLVIRTDELTLRYRESGKSKDHPCCPRRFAADNLSVELEMNRKSVRWTPDMADTGNLGGTARTLDKVSGPCTSEPGLISRDGWVVVDDSGRLLFEKSDGTDPGWVVPRERPGDIDWYFFGHGHDYKRALRDFTAVAGRIPLPPRCVFGMWWSRYQAYTDEQFKELVAQFRAHDVPMDMLAIDMDWHLDGWTGYTWNPKYFPDPEGFLKWLHQQGLHTTLNLHPADGVRSHEERFYEMARAVGLDPKNTDHIPFDCTDRRFMEAYFKVLHHPLERQGIDFWWIDWQQEATTKIKGLDPLWWLNHLHFTEAERNPNRRSKRPLILSRWGGLGNHRYPLGFSGDAYCDWDSLAFQPRFTAGAGNVGFGYWSHDIGGHLPGPVAPELYARWIQWGALSPILRTHATMHENAERRIWKFPKEVFSAARDAIHLRYALLPYIYTAARQCHDEALPLCRPLYYEWPEHNESYEFGGEYLFGDDLLASPVTAPMDPVLGGTEVRIWIPPGEWVHWFNGNTYAGPAIHTLLVPLDEIPLFVRAGAVIPMMPRANRTNERPLDPLILTIFPGPSGQTRIYEDDGESVGYQNGQCAWTPVEHHIENGVRIITIGPAQGSFPGMLERRQYEVRLRGCPPPRVVRVDGKGMPTVSVPGGFGWSYESKAQLLILRTATRSLDERTEIAVTP